MTDLSSFHDNYPVSRWQVLHLMSSQNACSVTQQATDTGLEDVGTHMGVDSAQGII